MNETGGPPRGEKVEDVLAAIRRLVTAEEEERRRSAAARPEGSLVLTSDMRVDDPAPAAGDPAAGDADDDPAAPARAIGTPEDDNPDDGLLDAGDLTIDAEELAAMVRDIVREELQGEMGERITANLRKMVRREIGRALAAKFGG